MSEADANGLVKELQRAHKNFRVIENRVHERGLSLVFAEISVDPRTICGWIEDAGGLALYVGKEYRFDGFVMIAEVR